MDQMNAIAEEEMEVATPVDILLSINDTFAAMLDMYQQRITTYEEMTDDLNEYLATLEEQAQNTQAGAEGSSDAVMADMLDNPENIAENLRNFINQPDSNATEEEQLQQTFEAINKTMELNASLNSIYNNSQNEELIEIVRMCRNLADQALNDAHNDYQIIANNIESLTALTGLLSEETEEEG
ncbi:MAG: hypothetical protein K6F99_06085 [Lachnospiraceae bacterium]|nr:hypothetical protein [Lachnospiraceae bacterium]